MKLLNIKLLTDENISPKVVSYLRQAGMDVLDTKEQHWQGKTDKTLLAFAYPKQRFVLTHDSDFGTLAINQGKACYGIFYLRLKNLKPENIIRVCEELFNKDLDIVPGTILVIEETRIRIRCIDV
ncbi:MAG: hypothetical protein GY862_09070 [Gammaproteobacteria bacterium]|nr:hypothetical protein [Gammaproteobacteria bacterium]